MAQLRAANRSLGDNPLVVLTAGQSDDPVPGVSPEINAQMAKISREMQAALPSLSSNSAQVVATKSHHFIQFEAPKLVILAVQQVVGAVAPTVASTLPPPRALQLRGFQRDHRAAAIAPQRGNDLDLDERRSRSGGRRQTPPASGDRSPGDLGENGTLQARR